MRPNEAGRGANVWSIAGAPERGAMRALIIYVCGLPPIATSMSDRRIDDLINYGIKRKLLEEADRI